jgi:hypothetical protein
LDAKTIAVVSVSTPDMLANGLTKAMPEPKHNMIFKRSMEDWERRQVRRSLSILVQAPAGGAAAGAPEGGALAGPSAPTSTSTRWALVTM